MTDCTCQTVSDEYSDHRPSCPIYIAGRTARLARMEVQGSMTKRYRCYGKDDLGYPYDAMSMPDEHGDWVRWEDYERIALEFRLSSQQAAALRDDRDRLRAALVRIGSSKTFCGACCDIANDALTASGTHSGTK